MKRREGLSRVESRGSGKREEECCVVRGGDLL